MAQATTQADTDATANPLPESQPPGQPPAQQPAHPVPKLTVPLDDAAREIQNELKIAAAIRAQRIRNRWELDHARTEKQEWVSRETELLNQLFGSTAMADECNDWVAPILPEYAELAMFIELFDNEMKHRIERLKSVLKRLPEYAKHQKPVEAKKIEAPEAPEAPPVQNLIIHNPQPLPGQAASSAAASGAAASPAAAAPAPPPAPARPAVAGALIVRGADADDQAQVAVAEFLAAIGVKPIVINRATTSGRPLVEELSGANAVKFALIFEGDDGSSDPAQAGQHLFELGCCVGRLGFKSVCVVSRAASELASDVFGVPHIPLDAANAWHLHLARYLRRAGISVDLNKLA